MNEENIFEQRLHVNIDKKEHKRIIDEVKKEEFLNELEKNIYVLYSFPVEKLKILEQYYNESILGYKQKILKLHKN